MKKKVSFSLGNSENYEFSVNKCIELKYNGNRFNPIEKIYAKFICYDINEINQVLTNFNVFVDNQPVFYGIVDKQIVSPIGYEYQLEIYASSKARLLVENKVIPKMLYRISTETLNNEYIKPFLKGNRFPYSTTINFINVPMGTSNWDIIDVFCKIMYNSPAFIDRDGYISITPFTNTYHKFSNYEVDTIKFNNIEFISSKKKLVSDLYLKTHEDNDGAVFDIFKENPLKYSLNINSKKYYDPPIAWAKSYDKYFKYFFQKDNREIELIKISINYLKDIKLGDLAEIDYNNILLKDLYVYEIETSYMFNKYKTYITLAQKKYLT